MQRVLLTGVTGYIGQHCAAELLRRDYEVVGTIRTRAKSDATREAIAKVASVDRLRFVEADLLSDSGWGDAVKGCSFVDPFGDLFDLLGLEGGTPTGGHPLASLPE